MPSCIKVEEADRTPNRLGQKRNSPQHKIIKTVNAQSTERIEHATREKDQETCKIRPIRITSAFSEGQNSKSQKGLGRCSIISKRSQMPVQTKIHSKTFDHNMWRGKKDIL